MDSPLATAPPAELAWEYWNGKDWYPVDLLKDETAAFTRTGHVLLGAVPKGDLPRVVLGAVAAPRYWLRARLAKGALPAPAAAPGRAHQHRAGHRRAVDRRGDRGRSTGMPDQVFTLAHRPVLAGTLLLEVDEGDGPQPWRRWRTSRPRVRTTRTTC